MQKWSLLHGGDGLGWGRGGGENAHGQEGGKGLDGEHFGSVEMGRGHEEELEVLRGDGCGGGEGKGTRYLCYRFLRCLLYFFAPLETSFLGLTAPSVTSCQVALVVAVLNIIIVVPVVIVVFSPSPMSKLLFLAQFPSKWGSGAKAKT